MFVSFICCYPVLARRPSFINGNLVHMSHTIGWISTCVVGGAYDIEDLFVFVKVSFKYNI